MVAISTIADIQPADLPQLPQATLDVLKACSAEDARHEEIAQKVSIDPRLTAEVLRIVNTPLFGLGREIQSIQHAVTLLGNKALRNIVLCLSIHQVLDAEALAELDLQTFWEDSLRRAVAARLLAAHTGLSADDAFTAGLLQDFGMLVLLHLHPAQQSHWPALRTMTPTARHQEEQRLFGHCHEPLAAQLMHGWGLPDSFTTALAQHHDHDATGPAGALAYTLWLADWLNALFVGEDKAACLDTLRASLHHRLGFDEAALEELLQALSTQLEQAAQDLGLHVTEQAEYQDILQSANRRLAEENRSYQELTWQLEHTLKERNRLSAELERELQLARNIQQSLLPAPMAAGFPVYGINVPAKQLSGDFFDYFALGDGRIYFNIADVSGKGTHAALLMAKTSSLFRCLGKRKMPLRTLLQTLNDEICETNIMGMFVTLIAGCYEPATRQVSLLNAGHLPALVVPQGGAPKSLMAQTPPLGIVADLALPEPVVVSLTDSRLYLVSDGVTETQKTNGTALGLAGFILLTKKYQQQPLAQCLQSIVTQLQGMNTQQLDDITLVGIE
ncbi:MAG: HDOD domain-containing protein [Gammaproteobacteria bacterium]